MYRTRQVELSRSIRQAIATMTAVSATVSAAYLQAFPQSGVIELSALNSNEPGGSPGLLINGIDANDVSGLSVSSAGDINGDGVSDVIIGAPYADVNGDDSGQAYVIFGQSDGLLPAVIELSALNLSDSVGALGILINGAGEDDRSGRSVSQAGDVNGDGVDDLMIGAFFANANGDDSGRTYVVFGQNDGSLPAVIQLSALNTSNPGGTAGLQINGVGPGDRSGFSVSGTGDINGDGVDDIIIGAPNADPNGNYSGETYIVFGQSDDSLPDIIELSALNSNSPTGTPGLLINGVDMGDQSARSVSGAEDINGDGVDDLLIGAPYGNSSGTGGGQTYVVFGQNDGSLPSVIELSALNTSDSGGTPGLLINGIDTADRSGYSVSNAGDINGDEVSDIVIGAYGAGPNGSFSGETYVIFGQSDGSLPSVIELSALNSADSGGTPGLLIHGIDDSDLSGNSVSNAGDVNGDGIDDLLIGARTADSNGISSGESYVVFGQSDGSLPQVIEIAALNTDDPGGTPGLLLNGIDEDDGTGRSVSNGADINGDGVDDLLIGASFADSNGINSGEIYVVFGQRPDNVFSDGFESQ